MEFFSAQETLTTFQWMLRAIVAFFFLLIAAKVMGQRSISQLRLLDFMMALLVGNIIAHPLSDEKLGLKGSMVTIAVLVFLYVFCVYVSLKWKVFRNFLDPKPFILIENGQIQYKNLKKARISLDYLLSELRKNNIDDIQKVALSLWEQGGTISTFLTAQHQNLTPSAIQLKVEAFDFQQPIIKEGKIDYQLLHQIGKDEEWLKKQVKINRAEISDVLLATIDKNNKISMYFYT